VSLYKVGDSYFVLDGHHCVSVAHYQGVEMIDAEVTEFRALSPVELRRTGIIEEPKEHTRPDEPPERADLTVQETGNSSKSGKVKGNELRTTDDEKEKRT